jgi:HEAT repeat protein
MALKLPKKLITELDRLMDQLATGDPDDRQEAIVRLQSYEKSGKIPLESLLEMADEPNMTMALYGIMALGRNGSSQAVQKLCGVLDKNREGNVVFLETLVDALGATGHKNAGPVLLELVGIDITRKGRLLKWLGRNKNKNKNEEDEAQTRLQEYLTLPVARAVENLLDPMAASALSTFLDHSDPLVRWHTIQALLKTKVSDFNDKLQELSTTDPNSMVKEAAEIALLDLAPLPPPLNN